MRKKWFTALIVMGIVVFFVGYIVGSAIKTNYETSSRKTIDIEKRLYQKK
jgi:hypothetical protein